MSGDDIGQAVYLGLLLAAVAGWFVVENHARMGKVAQQAAIWGLIFLGAVAAVGLWSDIRRTTFALPEISEDGTITVPRGSDGHFSLIVDVNDTPVTFLIDTGATDIVLSQRDAARVGIDVDGLQFLGQAQTANGITRTAAITLDQMRVGPIVDHDLRATVTEGDMDISLLGMRYLQLFPDLSITHDQMVLRR